jgi:hypothetical protein
MRGLADLLADPRGVAFLEEHGVFADDAAFAAELRPPERDGLTSLLDLARDCLLVYVGQQVCADLAPATAAKFTTARDAAARHGVTPTVLWHDMDSTQSERYGARIVLPSAKRTRGVWLVSRELEDLEPRFIPVDREHLEAVVADIASWTRSAVASDRREARDRLQRLSDALLAPHVATLADADRAIVSLLLREALGFDATATYASEMVASGLLVDSVVEYVAAVDDVVRVFNEAIGRLVAADIDPQVRLLSPDHLPLRFSCPLEGTRLRLSRELRGDDVYATATCRCKTRYEFDLGRGDGRLGELGQSGRWSIDVSMPIHHNDLASGWVAGRSTALYGLAFNDVLERVFGRRPIPILVPRELPPESGPESSLLVRWLTGTGAKTLAAP